MHKSNQKGFSAIEILLVLGVVGFVGAAGWYVYSSQNKKPAHNSAPAAAAQETSKPAEPVKDESEGWETIESGKKAFTVKIPDGWGELLRPLDSDWLTIRGTKQPVFNEGKPVAIRDLQGFGTDGPGVFSVLIHDNIVEPVGTPADFNIGTLKGKKYTSTSPQRSQLGEASEFGDAANPRYEYRFQLDGKNQLIVTYSVFPDSDNKDQVDTVDKIVKSIKLK